MKGLPWQNRSGRLSPLKLTVFLSLWLPALYLLYRLQIGDIGPRKWIELNHETGLWSLRFLVLSLFVTPIRKMFQVPGWIQMRRMVGLAALFYGLAHFLFYFADTQWDAALVLSEIIHRYYLLIGCLALIFMIALGATSTDSAIRKLGGKRWQKLHHLTYEIGLLAILHFFMQSNIALYEPAWMMGCFSWLMIYRLSARFRVRDSYGATLSMAFSACLFAMLFEAGWYQATTHIPGIKVLLANFHFKGSVRPAWWVLAGGLILAHAALLWNALRRQKIRPGPVFFPHRTIGNE